MENDVEMTAELSMGKCCICERENCTVRTIAMLDLKGTVEGQGWGCFQCGLPSSGAVAVLCDECAESAADTSEIKFACAGYPGLNVRVPVAELTEEFKHDPSKHPEVSSVWHQAGCGGTGLIECFCAGDFCACSMQGTGRCEGCQDCIDLGLN